MINNCKIKQLISVLLCLILTILASANIFAYDNSSMIKTNTKDGENREILVKAGIIDESELVDDESFVTRSDFIWYLSKLMNINLSDSANENYFADIEDERNAAYINYFAKCGYISSISDKKFRPRDSIKWEEACKIFVEILGYGIRAEKKGGFPSGYIYAVSNMDVTNYKIGTNVTEKMLIDMMVEFSEIPYYEVSSIGKKGSVYLEENEELNIFSIYHGIHKKEGFVTSVPGASFDGSVSGTNDIRLDGDLYDASYIDYPDGFLGRHIKLYYIEENGKKTCMCAFYSDKDKKSLIIDSGSFCDFSSDYILTYYTDNENHHKRTLRIDRGVSVILNGDLCASGLLSVFKDFTCGKIYLSDADSDGIYDHIVIKKYKNILVGSYDKDNMIFNDEISGRMYDLKDYKYVNIYDSEYKKQDFKSINPRSVLLIAESKNRWIEILTSNITKTGKVSSVEYGDNNRIDKITLDETSYHVLEEINSQTLKPYKNIEVKPGSSYKFYLNAFTDIVYYDVLDEALMKTGYVIDAAEEKNIKSTVKVRIVEDDGKIDIYRLEDKIKLDGIKIESGEVMGVLKDTENKIIPQIVMYKVNEDGYISELDTMIIGENESADNSLAMFENSSDEGLSVFSMGSSSKKRLGRKTLSGADTKIFISPEINIIKDKEYEDYMFKISKPEELLSDTRERFISYKTGRYKGYSDVIICFRDASTKYDETRNVVIVDKVIKQKNSDDCMVDTIVGMSGGNDITLFASDKYNKTKPLPKSGDVILCSTDLSGEFTDYVLIYDYQNDIKPDGFLFDSVGWSGNKCSDKNIRTLSQKFMCTLSYPAFKDKTVVTLASEKNEDFLLNTSDAIDLSSFSLMVYDSTDKHSKRKTYSGNINDIRDIKGWGQEECSKMLIHYRYASVRDVILFK